MTTGLRRWRRSPLLAVHHFVAISFGMAAVTAVVSLMWAMAFQPLRFHDAPQLVQVWNRVESGAPIRALSGQELTDLHEGTGEFFTSFGGFSNHLLWPIDEVGSSGPLRVLRMEEAAYRALALGPVFGRPVEGSISSPEGLGSVWISHNLWLSRYGGASSVIGQKIRLAGNAAGQHETQAEIAGVLPADIRIPFPVAGPFFDHPIDVWALWPDAMRLRLAKTPAFYAVGRLRPDRTLAEAQQALTVLADRRTRASDRRNRPVAQSFEEIASGPVRRTMGILIAGVGLVLVLAYANLASLTVAEGSRRRAELSIRVALGASRWRLWRALVVEHLILGACALGFGLALAWVTLRSLAYLLTLADLGPSLPHVPAPNVYVMLGFAAWALAATLVWATLIVRGVTAEDTSGYLGSGHMSGATRLSAADRHGRRLRLGALAFQACLGIALMVLAVSMARVYVRLTEANLGPAPDRTAFFSVRPALAWGAVTPAQAADFRSQVRSLVDGLPGVEATAIADHFPPPGSPISFWKHGDLADVPRDATSPVAVSPEYFGMLGIPILHGRGFAESDRYGGKAVAIIDRELARRHWASAEQAVNSQINFGPSSPVYEVIGVVGESGGYWASARIPTIYLSLNQRPSMTGVVMVRTASPTSGLTVLARQALERMPVRVEISNEMTLQDGWEATATRPRARMIGMLVLALIGLALGAQGVYALAASNVAARRQELAIRTALGASGSSLVWLVLRQVIVAVLVGSGAGVLGVIAVHRLAPQWISAALNDPAAPIALAFLVLLSTAVLGGLIPARAARHPPPCRGLMPRT